MADSGLDRLVDAKQRMSQLDEVSRQQEQLYTQLHAQESIIMKLELKLASEQAQVDRWSQISFGNWLHALFRNKEEALRLAREEALLTAIRLQEARQTQEQLKQEIVLNGKELGDCRHAEQEYARLMAEKEGLLRKSTTYAEELARMDAEIAAGSIHVKEVQEALTSGRGVLASLKEALRSLDKAKDWGRLDMWGGGVISTHIKHGHLDDAKRAIGKASRLIASFRDELTNLKQSIKIEIDISSMLKFGDYWFDGLITDWVVQKRIKHAHEQTLEAIHGVKVVVSKLQSEFTSADTALQGYRCKRIAWIEQQCL